MMSGCAVATGLLDGGEHVRARASCSGKRSGQRCRDLGAAPPDRGAGTPAGWQEDTVHPAGPGLASGAAAPAEAGDGAPDAVAGTPGHGAALAPRPDRTTARRPVQAQAA